MTSGRTTEMVTFLVIVAVLIVLGCAAAIAPSRLQAAKLKSHQHKIERITATTMRDMDALAKRYRSRP